MHPFFNSISFQPSSAKSTFTVLFCDRIFLIYVYELSRFHCLWFLPSTNAAVVQDNMTIKKWSIKLEFFFSLTFLTSLFYNSELNHGARYLLSRFNVGIWKVFTVYLINFICSTSRFETSTTAGGSIALEFRFTPAFKPTKKTSDDQSAS